MRSYGCAKRDPIKNYFPLPNEIFVLGLNAGEIAVYAYLLFCENRKTFQCWPSCRSIGRATGMSVNTVRKHIRSLEAKGLIATEPTTITDRYGRRRNGNALHDPSHRRGGGAALRETAAKSVQMPRVTACTALCGRQRPRLGKLPLPNDTAALWPVCAGRWQAGDFQMI